MSWSEMKERSSGEMKKMKRLVEKAYDALEEVCDMIEDMDDESYAERDDDDVRGDAWRIERERRGSRRGSRR